MFIWNLYYKMTVITRDRELNCVENIYQCQAAYLPLSASTSTVGWLCPVISIIKYLMGQLCFTIMMCAFCP
jgi:hypothetical protein